MKKRILLLLSMLFILFNACQKYTLKTVYPTLNDGKYDTEFPYKTCSKQIGEIVKSIKKIHCIAEYKTYIIPMEAEITLDMIDKKVLKQDNVIKKFDSESVIGTATAIFLPSK